MSPCFSVPVICQAQAMQSAVQMALARLEASLGRGKLSDCVDAAGWE